MFERVKELCAERGININQLETKLGFSIGTIGHWRESVPKADKLLAVADELGVSASYLYWGEETKKPATDNGDGRSWDGLRDTDWQEIAQRLKNESASAGDDDYISLDKVIDGFAKLPPESRKSFYQLLLIVNNGGESVRGLLDNLVEVLGKSS